MSQKRTLFFKTVGELKKSLADFPDDMPLALDGHGPGWGLKPPYIATHRWVGSDHAGFLTAKEAENRKPEQAQAIPLEKPMCVLEPSLGLS